MKSLQWLGWTLLLCAGCSEERFGVAPRDLGSDGTLAPRDFAVADLVPPVDLARSKIPAEDASSDVYPAPHAPLPQAQSSGGPELVSPRLTSITFEGDPSAADLDSYLDALPGTQFWAATMGEYGIGLPTVAPPVHLQEAAPVQISDDEIVAWLTDKLDGTHDEFGVPDGNSLYILYYPAGTTVTLYGLVSCGDYYAYHDSIVLGDGTEVAYAVVPHCDSADGLTGLDVLTSSASHEITEAASDPFPIDHPSHDHTDSPSWDFTVGGELGDLCQDQDSNYIKLDQTPYVVQRTWSNVAAAANHDPCVPAPAGVAYFNSAPVLPTTIHPYGTEMPGILAHAGEKVTIELDLFSDGPTPGWSLSATEWFPGSAQPALAFDFSAPTGNNGDKVQLTVTVLADNQYGFEYFYMSSTRGEIVNVWPVVVSSQ
jgi:hypothetical protein